MSFTYLIHNYQPICGLSIGVLLLIYTFALNFGHTKAVTTQWLKRKLYDNNSSGDYLTQQFVSGISKFALLFGLSLVALGIYFLEYVK